MRPQTFKEIYTEGRQASPPPLLNKFLCKKLRSLGPYIMDLQLTPMKLSRFPVLRTPEAHILDDAKLFFFLAKSSSHNWVDWLKLT